MLPVTVVQAATSAQPAGFTLLVPHRRHLQPAVSAASQAGGPRLVQILGLPAWLPAVQVSSAAASCATAALRDAFSRCPTQSLPSAPDVLLGAIPTQWAPTRELPASAALQGATPARWAPLLASFALPGSTPAQWAPSPASDVLLGTILAQWVAHQTIPASAALLVATLPQ
jgi:hypothetical protein